MTYEAHLQIQLEQHWDIYTLDLGVPQFEIRNCLFTLFSFLSSCLLLYIQNFIQLYTQYKVNKTHTVQRTSHKDTHTLATKYSNHCSLMFVSSYCNCRSVTACSNTEHNNGHNTRREAYCM